MKLPKLYEYNIDWDSLRFINREAHEHVEYIHWLIKILNKGAGLDKKILPAVIEKNLMDMESEQQINNKI